MDFKQHLIVAAKGAVVGGTMLVPGVSGGTMCIILGVYDRLIHAVSTFFQSKRANFWLLFCFCLGAGAGIFLLSKPLGAYLLGESYAKSMGVNIKGFRVALILLSSILSACVTAFAGPISFVGIAVPHITRMLFRTSRPMVLIPATFLTGSVFCLACDLIARTAFAPTELTISTVTSVLGAPAVIWLMIKRRRNS